jgi:hypothetical protein
MILSFSRGGMEVAGSHGMPSGLGGIDWNVTFGGLEVERKPEPRTRPCELGAELDPAQGQVLGERPEPV